MKAFEKVHPFVLLFYFLSVLLGAMFLSHPVLQLTALLGAIAFSVMLQGKSARTGTLGFYIPLFLLIAVTNPLFSHHGATPLFFLNGNPVTLEAFVCGAAMAVMIVGVMLWCRCCGEIMTSDKFLYLFGKAIPRLSLVLSMALRFIPLFQRQLRKVDLAQKAMGLYASERFTDRLKGRLRVFMAILSWSLENAVETAASMKARGYGIKGRTHFSLFRFSLDDGILLALCLLPVFVTALGAAAGWTAFDYYPRISDIQLTPSALCLYTAFAVLSFLPFIIEVKEVLVWKYCISRM